MTLFSVVVIIVVVPSFDSGSTSPAVW